MRKVLHTKAYEAKNGPHFNEEYAHKAVSDMENEDGSHGPHWSLEETTSVANQYNVNLNGKFNRYDWFVALNMVYSDYYKVITNITNSNNVKNFVEFAKAWLNDKDVDEGKMWYYYIYVMCDKIRKEEDKYYAQYREDDDDEDEEDERYSHSMLSRRRGRMGYMRARDAYQTYSRDDDYDMDDYRKYDDRDSYRDIERGRSARYIRY